MHQIRQKFKVDYVAVKYRVNSFVDLFGKSIKHTAARDGMLLDIEIPKFDGASMQNMSATDSEDSQLFDEAVAQSKFNDYMLMRLIG